MFSTSSYETLSEFATQHYTAGSYGVAFSILLESMLNFSYLGPLILSILIVKTIEKVLMLQYKFAQKLQ